MKNEYKTTERLVEDYAYLLSKAKSWDGNANGSGYLYDCKKGMNLIKDELNSRFFNFMRLLNDDQTIENPKGTYERLING